MRLDGVDVLPTPTTMTHKTQTRQSRSRLLAILLINFVINTHHQVVSSNDFELVKTHRYAEASMRNSFYLRSLTNDKMCTSRECEQRNSYLKSGGNTPMCQCQCQYLSVYSSALDVCILGTDDGEAYLTV